MTTKLTTEALLDDLTPPERERAERVESVLPALRDAAVEADRDGEFPRRARQDTRRGRPAGARRARGVRRPRRRAPRPGRRLLRHGHRVPLDRPRRSSSTTARRRAGLLPLEAARRRSVRRLARPPIVRAFAERLLRRMGEGRWMANFASESAKSASSAITIGTSAEPRHRPRTATPAGCSTA